MAQNLYRVLLNKPFPLPLIVPLPLAVVDTMTVKPSFFAASPSFIFLGGFKDWEDELVVKSC
ncbi:hypothetical protein HanPSC8_Chr05g0217351 [Helianthus annuus]|nr:hypothetical protein HanPSC8_Chr05g0217351 [Helianthus annuus]